MEPFFRGLPRQEPSPDDVTPLDDFAGVATATPMAAMCRQPPAGEDGKLPGD